MSEQGPDDGTAFLRSLMARSRARIARVAAAPPGPTPGQGSIPPGPVAPLKGLLDEQAEKAWEATLRKTELERWEELKQAIVSASPDMRWRAAGYAVRMELEYARRQLRIARTVANEPFKADLIAINGVSLRAAFERLEERLDGLYEYVRPMDALLDGVEAAWHAVESCQRTLGRVVSPWRGTAKGAERGDGVPGYDTPEGVERARQRVREAYARHAQERSAEKDPALQAAPLRGRKRPALAGNQPLLAMPQQGKG